MQNMVKDMRRTITPKFLIGGNIMPKGHLKNYLTKSYGTKNLHTSVLHLTAGKVWTKLYNFLMQCGFAK